MGAYALIAETDPARSALYGEMVRAEGLDPVTTRDGLEALDAMKERGAAETLRDHLGIKAILSKPADGEVLRGAVKRALAGAPTAEIVSPFAEASAAREEDSRLARVEAMGIVDDLPPDEALQKLVQKTAEGFRVPVALVSLILKDRQWFKAYFGLSGEVKEARGTPKEWAFCRHVVQGKEPLVVPDARSHPYFQANPLVKAGVIGSYAGAPLITPRGEVLGMLCIIDSKPLAISAGEVEVLALLARRGAGELEMRSEAWRKAARITRPDAGAPISDLEMTLAYLDSAVLLLDAGGKILFVSPAFDELFERPASNATGVSRDDFMVRCSAFFDAPEDFLRRTRVDVTGPYSGRETFRLRTPREKAVRWTARPVPRGNGFAQLESFTDISGGS